MNAPKTFFIDAIRDIAKLRGDIEDRTGLGVVTPIDLIIAVENTTAENATAENLTLINEFYPVDRYNKEKLFSIQASIMSYSLYGKIREEHIIFKEVKSDE